MQNREEKIYIGVPEIALFSSYLWWKKGGEPHPLDVTYYEIYSYHHSHHNLSISINSPRERIASTSQNKKKWWLRGGGGRG